MTKSIMSKYKVVVSFGEFLRELPTSTGWYATTLFEEAVMSLPGGFNEWHIASQFQGGAHFTNKNGEIATAQLYRYEKPVKDFDEEDKPQKKAPFTVFADGEQIPCDSTEAMARAIARIISETGRRPAVQKRRTAC